MLRGEKAAWDGFVRRYGGLIVAAVRGVAPGVGDIEDMSQEVFVRLCKDDFRLLRDLAEPPTEEPLPAGRVPQLRTQPFPVSCSWGWKRFL